MLILTILDDFVFTCILQCCVHLSSGLTNYLITSGHTIYLNISSRLYFVSFFYDTFENQICQNPYSLPTLGFLSLEVMLNCLRSMRMRWGTSGPKLSCDCSNFCQTDKSIKYRGDYIFLDITMHNFCKINIHCIKFLMKFWKNSH